MSPEGRSLHGAISIHGGADQSASRITIHYAFGGSFVTDAAGHQTYSGGKRLRVRWQRETEYDAIYKNLWETYCRDARTPAAAIVLYYQLPHDATSYMRNPRPFNSDAHVQELKEAHDLLEGAMEAGGMEHTKETRIRIFAIESAAVADQGPKPRAASTSGASNRAVDRSAVSPSQLGNFMTSRTSEDAFRTSPMPTHSRTASGADDSWQRPPMHSRSDFGALDFPPSRHVLSGALSFEQQLAVEHKLLDFAVSSRPSNTLSPSRSAAPPDDWNVLPSARSNAAATDNGHHKAVEMDMGRMGLDLLKFKDAHLMGVAEERDTGGSSSDVTEPHEMTNPQRVIRNSSISRVSAFAVTPHTLKRLTGSVELPSSPSSQQSNAAAHAEEDESQGRSSGASEAPAARQQTSPPNSQLSNRAAAQPGGALNRKKPGLQLQVGSGMQHLWEQDERSQDFVDGPPPLPEVPAMLQQIKGADLNKVKELGRGQFGSVWYCKWRGVPVAVKELHSATTPHNLREMLKEAETMAVLRHPCIIAFYGVVTDLESPQTVIEYLRDGSLRSKLLQMRQSGQPVSTLVKSAIALQAARGMEYLHLNRIVHFDLKCDNLLCDLRDLDNPVVKIGDMGLSKQKATTFVSGNMRGSLPWMAPELFPSPIQGAVKDRVTEKVDVFSFGVVLWEIWELGKQLYPDQTMGSMFAGIMAGNLRPPLPRDCHPDWTVLMQQCWATQPRQRPSFEEISAELQRIVNSATGRA